MANVMLGDREPPPPREPNPFPAPAPTPAPAPSPAPAPAPTTPTAPAPTAPAGPPKYNTTPNFKDPYNPPSPGDPYWDEWIAVNPDYRGQGYTGPAPTTINPSGTTNPPSAPSPAPSPTASTGYPGTSVFSDPATQNYEQLINALTSKLNTPYQAPDYQPMIDSLNAYIKQLQGPAYTPAQQDVMQTQALDPLERQRQAARQQVIQRMGAQGIPPSSGIVEKALENVDNQYNTIRAQTQSSFATNQIGVQRQNQAQAASLYPSMVGLENQQYQGGINNQLQAVNLAGIIPQTAWSRLTGAQNLMGQSNPLGALQLQSLFQNNGYNQSADYSSGLMQLLMQLMGQ